MISTSDFIAAYELACVSLDRFGSLDSEMKMKIAEILEVLPCEVQAWIDSKSSEEICEFLF